jgi:hypothetical protein
MKRYRVLAFDFDMRANVLRREIENSWDPKVKEEWESNKKSIKEGLLAQYGCQNYCQKIENFVALGNAFLSIIAFHNEFYRQARNAFVVGAYYPCLTAACALGERILNQLVIHLRDDFKASPEYKKVYRKDSFDNWDLAIDTLVSWQVLLPNVADSFRRLRETRHRAIHFNPETDHNDRQLALDAMKELSMIIEGQFAAFGHLPCYIPGTQGAAFVKKAAETEPFVWRIVLPNCRLVGPLHTLEHTPRGWLVHDDHDYEDRDISDEEFKDLYNNRKLLPGNRATWGMASAAPSQDG